MRRRFERGAWPEDAFPPERTDVPGAERITLTDYHQDIPAENPGGLSPDLAPFTLVWVQEEIFYPTCPEYLAKTEKRVIFIALLTKRAFKEVFERALRGCEEGIREWVASGEGRDWWRNAFPSQASTSPLSVPPDFPGAELLKKVPKGFVSYRAYEYPRFPNARYGFSYLSVPEPLSLSLDPQFPEFRYISPPSTCTEERVDEWVAHLCDPFVSITKEDIEWATGILHDVGRIGRLLNEADVGDIPKLVEPINDLAAKVPPYRKSLDPKPNEFELFWWAIQCFSASLIQHLMDTRGIRRCVAPRCVRPYFLPKREKSSQKYCSSKCRKRFDNHKNYRKRREARARRAGR